MKYRLPDKVREALSGGEIEAEKRFGNCAGSRAEYHLPGGIAIVMPPGEPLEPVTPPLPPEPPVGAYLINGRAAIRTEDDDEVPWCMPSGMATAKATSWLSWKDITNLLGPALTVVRLVSDPLADAPELPWVGEITASYGVSVSRMGASVRVTSIDGDGPPIIHPLPPFVAREMARALWRACAEIAALQATEEQQ